MTANDSLNGAAATTNGHSNSTSNGHSNSTSNSHSNSTSNSHSSGTSNGTSNGHSSELKNGTSNGHSNGTTNAIVPPKTYDHIPDLSTLLRVERSAKAFSSRAISLVSLPAGSLFTPITTATPTATPAYSSVQTSESTHIELNSDLLYINHSCHPSVIFDMEAFEVRVVADRDLKEGDELTFWYPSSEWNMVQPFECGCRSEMCRGTISGAGQMEEDVVRGYWLNKHIERMLDARKAAAAEPDAA